MDADPSIDAVLLVSFGGPEGPDDVIPFLENVTRGRGVPTERLAEVAEVYAARGGHSPLNPWCRSFADRLRTELDGRGLDLPVYWGNRNWHPHLADTVAAMAADGVRHAVAFVTSAYSSYSGCRQYLDDIEAARRAAGRTAPRIDKLRPFFDHPGFVTPMADGVRAALSDRSPDGRAGTELVFTAHSLPASMARACDYEVQLAEAARLVAERAGAADLSRDVVFQSRSGPPQVPWLGPDINDHLHDLAERGCRTAVVVPVGFVADHMEVVHDLDTVAAATAARLGLEMVRVATPGDDARFVELAVDLVEERRAGRPPAALGRLGLRPDPCATGCCPAPARPGAPGRP